MEKSKPPIIFLHAALGTSDELGPLMQLMQKKGFTTHTFNFSGHGATPWPSEFRIDLFARDLEKFIKAQGLTDAVVFGHSMGGYVALYHKVNYEDSPISQIFTYGTKFNWSSQAVAKELPMLNPEHLAEKFPNLAQALQQKHGERWKNLMFSTAHMVQNLERLDGLTREDMEDVTIPVTLMLGDQDRVVTSEETHFTATWLHQIQIKIISHSKHDLERTNIKEIATIMEENIS